MILGKLGHGFSRGQEHADRNPRIVVTLSELHALHADVDNSTTWGLWSSGLQVLFAAGKLKCFLCVHVIP